MIKKRYIKRLYVEEAYCDKCGAQMKPTGFVLTTWPEQYPYECSNPECDGSQTFWGSDRPVGIKYEFEDEEDV